MSDKQNNFEFGGINFEDFGNGALSVKAIEEANKKTSDEISSIFLESFDRMMKERAEIKSGITQILESRVKLRDVCTKDELESLAEEILNLLNKSLENN